MKMLIKEEDLPNVKYVPIECSNCQLTFYVSKSLARRGLKGTKGVNYCSKSCSYKGMETVKNIICKKCSISFKPLDSKQKFCSQLCANRHNGNNNVHLLPQAPQNIQKMIATSKLVRDQKTLNKKILYDHSPAFCQICNSKLLFNKRKLQTCSKQCRSTQQRDISITLGKIGGNKNRYATGWYESSFAGKVYLESSWELKLAKDLDLNKINWCRPKFLPWIDKDGVNRKYFPDFYLRDFNIYLDPKNPFIEIRDRDKLNRVREQHNIKLLVLTKNQLSWDSVKQLIL